MYWWRARSAVVWGVAQIDMDGSTAKVVLLRKRSNRLRFAAVRRVEERGFHGLTKEMTREYGTSHNMLHATLNSVAGRKACVEELRR